MTPLIFFIPPLLLNDVIKLVAELLELALPSVAPPVTILFALLVSATRLLDAVRAIGFFFFLPVRVVPVLFFLPVVLVLLVFLALAVVRPPVLLFFFLVLTFLPVPRGLPPELLFLFRLALPAARWGLPLLPAAR